MFILYFKIMIFHFNFKNMILCFDLESYVKPESHSNNVFEILLVVTNLFLLNLRAACRNSLIAQR